MRSAVRTSGMRCINWFALQCCRCGCATLNPRVSGDPQKEKGSKGGSMLSYKSTHKGKGVATPLSDLRPKFGGASGGAPADVSAGHVPSSAATSTTGGGGAMEMNLAGLRSSCAEDSGAVPKRNLSPLQRRQLLMRHKAPFTLTPQALRRIKFLLSQFEKAGDERGEKGGHAPDGIRISVRRRGCSGYSYTVNYHYSHGDSSTSKAGGMPVGGDASSVSNSGSANSSYSGEGNVQSAAPGMSASTTDTKRGDVVVVQDGVKVVVESEALFYVIGTEMDYIVRNVEEKFTFRNPNQKYSCGCEESFMPFDADEKL
ncbi:iron-sulfur cluster assembly protein [Trypanosoma vivax]|nr:iron-sulfur cluster assembly protein [Trypanosoma vivax]